jgi:hypothetical protein
LLGRVVTLQQEEAVQVGENAYGFAEPWLVLSRVLDRRQAMF